MVFFKSNGGDKPTNKTEQGSRLSQPDSGEHGGATSMMGLLFEFASGGHRSSQPTPKPASVTLDDEDKANSPKNTKNDKTIASSNNEEVKAAKMAPRGDSKPHAGSKTVASKGAAPAPQQLHIIDDEPKYQAKVEAMNSSTTNSQAIVSAPSHKEASTEEKRRTPSNPAEKSVNSGLGSSLHASENSHDASQSRSKHSRSEPVKDAPSHSKEHSAPSSTARPATLSSTSVSSQDKTVSIPQPQENFMLNDRTKSTSVADMSSRSTIATTTTKKRKRDDNSQIQSEQIENKQFARVASDNRESSSLYEGKSPLEPIRPEAQNSTTHPPKHTSEAGKGPVRIDVQTGRIIQPNEQDKPQASKKATGDEPSSRQSHKRKTSVKAKNPANAVVSKPAPTQHHHYPSHFAGGHPNHVAYNMANMAAYSGRFQQVQQQYLTGNAQGNRPPSFPGPPSSSVSAHQISMVYGKGLPSKSEAKKIVKTIHTSSSRKANDNEEFGESSKPRRPLTSYNIFFQLGRRFMLENREISTMSIKDVEELQLDQKARHKQRTTHSKTHGKIPFREMAIKLSKEWKQIDPEVKKCLESRAESEKTRYRTEIAEWKKLKEEHEAKKAKENTPEVPKDYYHEIAQQIYGSNMNNGVVPPHKARNAVTLDDNGTEFGRSPQFGYPAYGFPPENGTASVPQQQQVAPSGAMVVTQDDLPAVAAAGNHGESTPSDAINEAKKPQVIRQSQSRAYAAAEDASQSHEPNRDSRSGSRPSIQEAEENCPATKISKGAIKAFESCLEDAQREQLFTDSEARIVMRFVAYIQQQKYQTDTIGQSEAPPEENSMDQAASYPTSLYPMNHGAVYMSPFPSHSMPVHSFQMMPPGMAPYAVYPAENGQYMMVPHTHAPVSVQMTSHTHPTPAPTNMVATDDVVPMEAISGDSARLQIEDGVG